MTPKKPLTFVAWIDKKGPNYIAKCLNIDPATVRYWRRGDTDPRVDQMRQIKKISKGKIGYDQIIDRPQGRAK